MPAAPDTGIQRTPPYMQVADALRQGIHAGHLDIRGRHLHLGPGEQLPPVGELGDLFGVARATAAKAIGQLQVERAVWASNRGTFVAGEQHITRTPGDRLRSPFPAHLGPRESVRTDEAGIVAAPDYVAELLGVDPGALVVRRQEITHQAGRPVTLTVDWIPASDHRLAAEAAARHPLPGGTGHLIATLTGRRITHVREHLHAREADRREARALDLEPGTPVLGGTSVISDADGVLWYSEWVNQPEVVVTYSYEVAGG